MYASGAPANRIRGMLAFENMVFCISDEVLCCIELGRFCTVLSITLINEPFEKVSPSYLLILDTIMRV